MIHQRLVSNRLKTTSPFRRHPASGGRKAAGNSAFGAKTSPGRCITPELTLGARLGLVRQNVEVIFERFLCAFVLAAACLLTAGPLSAAEASPDVVYVPTPHDVVDKMLKLAKVTKDDVVYDLGCGDGRIVVTAARKIGCRGIGFEIDPDRIKDSNDNVKKYGVGKLVEIKNQNIFDTDLSKASVITLYLLPGMNKRLVPQFEKMKPGSRIVSHAYDMPGIKPDKKITVKSREDNASHVIYLWTIPLKKIEKNKPAEKPL